MCHVAGFARIIEAEWIYIQTLWLLNFNQNNNLNNDKNVNTKNRSIKVQYCKLVKR